MSRTSAAAIAGGVWVGTTVPAVWWTAVRGVVALTAACGFVAARRGRDATDGSGRDRSRALLAVAAVAMTLVGAGLAGGRMAMRDGGRLAAAGPRAHRVDATVVTEPRTGPFDNWMIVRVERLDGEPIRQRALLRSRDRPPVGSRVVLRAAVDAMPDDGFGRYVRGLGAGWRLRPVGSLAVMPETSPLLRSTTFVRDRLAAVAGSRLSPAKAGILTGLVTGDARARPRETDDMLARAGLLHLVVVSGRHTALFLAAVLGLCMILGLPFRTRRAVSLCALGWFVVLVRWQPSVLRAATVAAIILVADVLGRDRDPVHLLCMTVTMLLLVDPLLGRQLGFVLSVAATAGVLVIGPVVRDRLRGPRWWRVGIGAASGAQLAVAPVLVMGGMDVPVAGVAANLVAAPAAAVAQMVGSIAALVAVLSPSAATAVIAVADPALSVVLHTAQTAAAAPPLGELIPSFAGPVVFGRTLAGGTVVTAAVAAVAAGILLVAAGRRRVAWLVVATAVIVVWAPASAPDVRFLTVTALDVGQGDAILVESPASAGTARLLVDGGPNPSTLARDLQARGVRRLDAVVLTHPHADHSAGLPAVLSRLHVGALLVGDHGVDGPPTAGSHGSTARDPPGVALTYAAARGRGVPIIEVRAGMTFRLGRARVEVLAPPPGMRGWSSNDRSVVLRVDGRWGDALLTGDVEQRAQRWLLRDPDAIDAALLKVPHHGGATNAAGFLDRVSPDIALVSVGAGNDYGHPSRTVLRDLRGVRVERTDTAGTVRVELGPDGPLVTAAGT